MMTRTVMTIALALAAGTAAAQEPPKSAESEKFYKLEFVVKEVEGGKVLNARSYSMTAAADVRETAVMRTGTKVPVSTGGSSFQYMDVGVNIDCRTIRELQRGLSMIVNAEISSLPSGSETHATGLPTAPVLRQNRWGALVVVPLKKPTLIFSSDDLGSKRQMQLELTATPIT